MVRFLQIVLFLIVTSLFSSVGDATADDVRIGVLSVRGPEDTVAMWQQIADHLNATIAAHHFVIVPCSYKEMEKAVAREKLDFVIANPSQYIELSVRYGASRIATQISHVGEKESSYVGSVIFAKSNRTDIAMLADLKGKTLSAASKTAFASWLVTRDELKHQGILEEDLAAVRFTGSSADKVVMAVRNGESDVGSVRTDVLERMALEGKLSLSEFRIINEKHVAGFPFLLSSELYPDFAFASLKHTDPQLANRVAAQLLLMPHRSPSIRYPNPIGWSVPHNYDTVRNFLQEWQLPPYEDYGKVSLGEAIRQHWVTVSLAVLSCGAFFLIVVLSLNIRQRRMKYRELKEDKQKLEEYNKVIKEQRDLLSRQKIELEQALAQVKQLEGIIPICSYCHNIRDDKNSWFQLEEYISGYSEAQFSHGVCPNCFDEQVKLLGAAT